MRPANQICRPTNRNRESNLSTSYARSASYRVTTFVHLRSWGVNTCGQSRDTNPLVEGQILDKGAKLRGRSRRGQPSSSRPSAHPRSERGSCGPSGPAWAVTPKTPLFDLPLVPGSTGGYVVTNPSKMLHNPRSAAGSRRSGWLWGLRVFGVEWVHISSSSSLLSSPSGSSLCECHVRSSTRVILRRWSHN